MLRHICEDEREDARMSRFDDVHPVLRRAHFPEPETGKCRACGERQLLDDLTDDLLCKVCNGAVKEMEEGRI